MHLDEMYQGFIQDFEMGGGGGKQDGTSSQIASDVIWDKISKQHFDDTYIHVCSVTCK